jgi:hypothetical protein
MNLVHEACVTPPPFSTQQQQKTKTKKRAPGCEDPSILWQTRTQIHVMCKLKHELERTTAQPTHLDLKHYGSAPTH